MKRFAYFVNLLFALVLLCNTLFCVRRFAKRRTIAKPGLNWQALFRISATGGQLERTYALRPLQPPPGDRAGHSCTAMSGALIATLPEGAVTCRSVIRR